VEFVSPPPRLFGALGPNTFILESETLYELRFLESIKCSSLVLARLVTTLTGWEELETLPTGLTAVSELVLIAGGGTVGSKAFAPDVSELYSIVVLLLGVMRYCIFLTFSVLLTREHTMVLKG
jgi:hypothetical protein